MIPYAVALHQCSLHFNVICFLRNAGRFLGNRFCVVTIAMLITSLANADHFAGGEITWECLPNGNYRFIVRFYRDCAGVAMSGGMDLQSTSPAGLIKLRAYPMNGFHLTNLTPACNPDSLFPHIIPCQYTPGAPNPVPISGAIEEGLFTSDDFYPNGVQLNGVPPPQGWVFSYTSCCRNVCSNIPNTLVTPWFLRAVMYPYQGQNAFPCYDNSPRFAEKPITVTCTGYPFTYSPGAYDEDLDSLSFEWAQPLYNAMNAPIINYNPGYSYTSPLPGPFHNPANVPATMNPHSGEISFTSFTQGAFVTVNKVSAFRCGVKIADVYREMQLVLLPCGNNLPPVVTPPFQNAQGQYTLYSDTVYAGQIVDFLLSAIDTTPLLLANGDITTVTLEASGAQFGANFVSETTGCLNPPCATLSPAPPFSNLMGLSSQFHWQTDCSHLDTVCGNLSNVYHFFFRVMDDFCPVPGLSFKTLSLVVQDPVLSPPPLMHCASVQENGDVLLRWSPPDTFAVPNTFHSYLIYSATSPTGPFSLLDSLLYYDSTTYLHSAANAQLSAHYYFIRTRSGCYSAYLSPSSDTIASVYLDVSAPNGISALLQWNNTHTPFLSASQDTFSIHREYPTGQWNLLDSRSALTYMDTMEVCLDTANYRIYKMHTEGMCASNIASHPFQDDHPPQPPNLDSVSIDPVAGSILLGWQPSPSADVGGYIVFRLYNSWLPLDTVWGGNQTAFEDLSSAASLCQDSRRYALAALDTCGNLSALALNQAQHSLFLQIKDVDVCKGKLMLDWNPYENFHPFLKHYRIFESIDGQAFGLISTLTAPDSLTPPADSLKLQHLTPGRLYCYQVQAVSGGDPPATSSSCIQCIRPGTMLMPEFLSIRFASVEGEHILLCIHNDTMAATSHYLLHRAEAEQGPFELIATLPFENQETLCFEDQTAEVHRQSYYYRVDAVDSCGNPSGESQLVRSILLTVTAREDLQNLLQWNPYQGWDSLAHYRVLQRAESAPFKSIALTSAVKWMEDVSVYVKARGQFTYRIEAVQGQSLPDFRDTARSNMVRVQQESLIYIPNAFTPGGRNPLFKPVCSFIHEGEYLLRIFNRWGQEIFSCTDPDQGWDGRMDGSFVPGGTYIYLLRLKNSQGLLLERRGGVSVIY